MNCQRCRNETSALIMSKFNTEQICLYCHDKEILHPKYQEADLADIAAIQAGDFNFPGIGCPPELQYRSGLPPMPDRIRKLPIERGYPVPWFVCEVDGHYDFRVIDARKFKPALEQKLCWVCGEPLGTALAFTIGPMCAINRTISEPPSHRECAEFSIKACPFLTQQQLKRNESKLPEGYSEPAGVGIKRQPGAICLWVTKSFRPFKVDNGVLFRLGEPEQVFWFREGREATRAEVLESIESGLPLLKELAEPQGKKAMEQLEKQIRIASQLLPPEEPKKSLFGSAAKR